MKASGNALDKAINYLSPAWGARRFKARTRVSGAVAARNLYEAAQASHRTSGWRIVSGDVNSEIGPAAVRLRQVSRHMLQNNAYAVKGKSLLVDNIIGSGIDWKVTARTEARQKRIQELVKAHFLSTAIDADGMHNIYGLQGLAMGTIVEAGSVLVRKRLRRIEDGYPLPFQIQVLEPDFIDTSIDGPLPNGNYAVQGVEYDLRGKRVAYYLFDEHPGARSFTRGSNFVGQRVSADFVHEIFRVERPGQVHGVSWFAPVIVRMQDLADYLDAALLRQKIAACFAAFVISDDPAEINPEGEMSETGRPVEQFEPGMIERLRPGEDVKFGQPPTTSDLPAYHKMTVREIAVGLGVPYESLAGDLENVNYTSGRMGRIDFYRSVARAQWQMFIPMFCGKLEAWTQESLFLLTGSTEPLTWEWTPPAPELMDPDTEIKAAASKIRAGLSSRQEEARKLGVDVEVIDKQIAEDNERADGLGLVFDTDPRKRTLNGVNTDKSAGPAQPEPGTEPGQQETPRNG